MYDYKLHIYDLDNDSLLLKKLGIVLGTQATIGSDQSSDVFINNSIIAHNHVSISYQQKGKMMIINNAKDHQTYYNGKILRFGEGRVLKHGDKIQMLSNLGNYEGVLLVITKPFFEHDVNTKTDLIDKLKNKSKVFIGRDESCDLVLKSMAVSGVHASIAKVDNDYILQDLNSTNGTYVDGKRITKPTRVTKNSKIYITKFVICLQGNNDTGLSGVTSIQDRLAIETKGILKEYPDKKNRSKKNIVLQSTDLQIASGTLTGLMGPSGCGKSTLLKSLNGDTPASRGDVYLFNLNLIENYDYLKTQIGYVPQDDTIHKNLKVRETLYYTAKLRLPNPNDLEINEKIDHVLGSLNLNEHENKYVYELSGGQRKRLCVANELLTDPTLLFLDEPTSPLDPKNIKDFLEMLRKLSKEHQTTVVMVTHKPEDLKFMDDVIFMAEGGHITYHDNKDGYMDYFKVNSPVDVYPLIADENAKYWIRKYNDDKLLQKNIDNLNDSKSLKTNNKSFLFQFFWLSKRNVSIKLNDKQASLVMLCQAPIIAFLVCIIFNQINISLLFIIALSSIWFGTNNASREIVSENAIFKRERMFNLDIWPYIFSKLFVLSLFSLAQSFLFVLMISIGFIDSVITLNNPVLVFLWISLVSVTATVMGLLISSLGKNVESVLSIVPIVLIPQIMLAGVVEKITSPLVEIISYFTLSRWGTEALTIIQEDIGLEISAVDALKLKFYDDCYLCPDGVSQDIIILLSLMFVMLIVIRTVLKNKDSVSI